MPDYTLEVMGNAEAFVTEPGELSDLLARSVEAETGIRPALSTSGGTSDARFVQRYCPVIEFGLCNATMHKRDEAVQNLGGYLRGIARRKLIEHYRGLDHQPGSSGDDGSVSQLPTASDGAATLLSRREDVALLAQALRSLPEDDQQLVQGLTFGAVK